MVLNPSFLAFGVGLELEGVRGCFHTSNSRFTLNSCFTQVSVVDELGIPVKFLGVGEGVEDLQPFDAEAFVNAIFS